MIWVQGLLCGAVVALAPPLALLLAVLLAPAAVVVTLEADAGRPTSRSLLLFGLSASVDPVRRLWGAGDTIGASLRLLGEPRVLAIAWGAAAGAWVLTELTPAAVGLVLDAAGRSRAARLRARRERLLQDWPGLGTAARTSGTETG